MDTDDEDEEECCGTCRWFFHNEDTDEFYCGNVGTEYYKEPTEYLDSCGDYVRER